MSYAQHIIACNRHDPDKFRPFLVDGVQVGRVRLDVSDWLCAHDGVFLPLDGGGVRMHPDLSTPDQRSAALDQVCQSLQGSHGIPALRGERYRVATGWGQPQLMTVDRAVVSLFGVRAYGVHVNGFTRLADGRLALWVARRAWDRPLEPGKLDNLVAGGQPAHLGLMDNLIKEAAEEAGIPAALARTARPAGAISYCLEDRWGLKPDVMYCFDLAVSADFRPVNTDGEVAEFHLMPVTDVAALIAAGTEFKYNVNLVIMDFLIRHGFITPDQQPDYLDLIHGLHRGL